MIAALAEAQDINLHLKPLGTHFEEIEQAEFTGDSTELWGGGGGVCYLLLPCLLIAALAEAQDINLHLKPLRSHFTGGQHRTAGKRVGGVCCLLLPCLFVCWSQRWRRRKTSTCT